MRSLRDFDSQGFVRHLHVYMRILVSSNTDMHALT